MAGNNTEAALDALRPHLQGLHDALRPFEAKGVGGPLADLVEFFGKHSKVLGLEGGASPSGRAAGGRSGGAPVIDSLHHGQGGGTVKPREEGIPEAQLSPPLPTPGKGSPGRQVG